ncbi:hypothetical protein Ahy_A07g034726 [Arachis hypogaea]|uniref:Uncharacterized protein n=1 Tax=Arachis hypogaea TaxID=3818 RepID=A0A445CCM6_ARAHY|nr:hypothetical protein Ahy_A07g034726 [Arachis hypogaea]
MRSKIKFTDKDPLSVFYKTSTSFTKFQNTILQKLGLHGVKQMEKLFYRISICMLRDDVKYDSFVIGILFHCRRQFFEVRSLELLAKFVDVNPQSSAIPVCSSSMPFGASSAVPVITHEAVLVASLSFAADLNHSCDGGIGDFRFLGELAIATASALVMVTVFREGGVPDSVEDVLNDDDDDDFTTIADDSDDNIARTSPIVDSGASILGIQQYPHTFHISDETY